MTVNPWVTLLWLFIQMIQVMMSPPAKFQSTLEDARRFTKTISGTWVTCSTMDGAIVMAEAIGKIHTLRDGRAAFEMYLAEDSCSFTNDPVVDAYEALWGPPNPDIDVYVLQAVEAVEIEEANPQYIVLAPFSLMDSFWTCAPFLDEATNTIQGCGV